MKRSVITDEISQDLGRAISLAREFGLEGLDIRTVWEKRIDLLDEDELSRLRSAADDAGLAIPSIAPPFLKCTPDEWDEHKRVLDRSIRASERLGSRIIRGFTFWKGSASWAQIVDAYREVAPRVEDAGMILGIENEPSCEIGTTEPLPELLAAIGSPAVKVLWDPANGAHDHERPVPDAFERVIADTVHVHLKDGRHVNGKWEHAIVGEGAVDVLAILRALTGNGYAGWVALETHYRPKPTGADLTRPGGSALSELGEEGTRACLIGWDKALKLL